MAVKCTNCGGAHPSWDCSKPTKSTVARKTDNAGYAKAEHRVAPETVQVSSPAPATSSSHKPKIGRPRTGYIKAEYNRLYMADLRTIKRLGLSVTVKKYRESLK